ncbi:hypothetical protein J2S25_004078 [Mesobacillus stamsii]|uniref:DUF2442 domain-containing protein n=1 Tax=Mesobacillus stamsii TaxID=225347 RepID=A0ABU0G0W2_9BACI|nr:hypothetical protein [Mesobacillus stamsii]
MFATLTFKLILEVNQEKYWLLDMKKFLLNDIGKLSEIRDDIKMFQTVKIDKVNGNVVWENCVDFDNELLIENSLNIDFL